MERTTEYLEALVEQLTQRNEDLQNERTKALTDNDALISEKMAALAENEALTAQNLALRRDLAATKRRVA